LLFIILIPHNVLAQGPNFLDDTFDAPVDGGLSLLIACGIGYAIKKTNKTNHKVSEKDN